MQLDIPNIPHGWFIYGMGECVKPIHYKGDEHENTGEGFWCEIQHREGGKLTKAKGESFNVALSNAIENVQRCWPDFVP